MTMTKADQSLTLVIAENGKTGRRVLDKLTKAGRPVRGLSRSSAIVFDWTDETTWPAALQGADRAYVSYQPDLAVPGAVEAVSRFFAAALKAGLDHVVFLTGRGEPEAEQAEAALRMSGLDWTILRAGFFHQNFSEGFLADAVLAGQVSLPEGLAKEPFIDADDIADVAVAALLGGDHKNQLYELTGPDALSFEEAVAILQAASGSTIEYRSLSADAFRSQMSELGYPEDAIALSMYVLQTTLDGRNVAPADGVRRALGRPPRSFSAYAIQAFGGPNNP